MNSNKPIKEMQSALQQAGIDCLEFNKASLAMKEITGLSMVRMHSLVDPGQLQPGPFVLPDRTGHCCGIDPAVLCLRPREWLLISATVAPADLLEKIGVCVEAKGTSAWNNSDGLAVFRLSGDPAPWLLSKLSGLDYLAGAGAGEHCARTRMGHVAVIVHYHPVQEAKYVFDLVFDRSVAKYLWELLCASAPHADDLAQAYGNAA